MDKNRETRLKSITVSNYVCKNVVHLTTIDKRKKASSTMKDIEEENEDK